MKLLKSKLTTWKEELNLYLKQLQPCLVSHLSLSHFLSLYPYSSASQPSINPTSMLTTDHHSELNLYLKRLQQCLVSHLSLPHFLSLHTYSPASQHTPIIEDSMFSLLQISWGCWDSYVAHQSRKDTCIYRLPIQIAKLLF